MLKKSETKILNWYFDKNNTCYIEDLSANSLLFWTVWYCSTFIRNYFLDNMVFFELAWELLSEISMTPAALTICQCCDQE